MHRLGDDAAEVTRLPKDGAVEMFSDSRSDKTINQARDSRQKTIGSRPRNETNPANQSGKSTKPTFASDPLRTEEGEPRNAYPACRPTRKCDTLSVLRQVMLQIQRRMVRIEKEKA